MNILNLHGYGGSPQNAAYTALQENGCHNITAPALPYDTEPADVIFRNLCETAAAEKTELLTGTSLGGFFAAALSAELHLPVILVNPCLMPFLHLPRLGFRGEIKPFIPLFGKLADLDPACVSCIVGGADDVIDTHDLTENLLKNERFRIVPGGKHSGFTLPLKEYFGEVLRGC